MDLSRHRTRGGRPAAGRPATAGSWLPLLVLCVGLAVTLGGCGGSSPDSGEDLPEQRTSDLLLTSESLPRGWGDSNSQGIDYRTTVCGVDLEPEPPARATSIRFSKGPVGPFLEQHVRVYRDDVVSGVISKLREALADCTGYEARGSSPDSPTARFEVAPLTVASAPEESIAWRQVSQGELSITSDILLVRRGNAAVLLMSYALRAEPDPAVLEQAAAAIPEAG